MEDHPPDAPGPDVPSPGFTPPPPSSYAPSPPPGDPPVRPPIPWEDPARPKLAAFFETIQLLFGRTREAYERMPVTSDVLKPYLFALIAGWFGVAVGTMWRMVFSGVMQSLIPKADTDYGFLKTFVQGPIAIALAPALIAVGLLVWALVYHLFLMMVGGAKAGFAATLRVICYAQSAMLIQILPFCGGLVGGVVALVFTIIGFSVVHKISNGRATLAALLPLILCCACIAIAFAIGGAAFMQQLHNHMGQ